MKTFKGKDILTIADLTPQEVCTIYIWNLSS